LVLIKVRTENKFFSLVFGDFTHLKSEALLACLGIEGKRAIPLRNKPLYGMG